MNNSIDELVKYLLVKHPQGGESYFDELDNYVNSEDYYLELMFKMVDYENTVIVTSGKFGEEFARWATFSKTMYPAGVIVFNGGLRKNQNAVITNKIYFKNYITRYVYMDDSYYSGKTYFKCLQYVRQHLKIEMPNIYVVYDGSLGKQKNIHSLYRYYDHH